MNLACMDTSEHIIVLRLPVIPKIHEPHLYGLTRYGLTGPRVSKTKVPAGTFVVVFTMI